MTPCPFGVLDQYTLQCAELAPPLYVALERDEEKVDIFLADPFNYNTVANDTWYNITVVKSGNIYKYYIDGLLDKSVVSSIS